MFRFFSLLSILLVYLTWYLSCVLTLFIIIYCSFFVVCSNVLWFYPMMTDMICHGCYFSLIINCTAFVIYICTYFVYICIYLVLALYYFDLCRLFVYLVYDFHNNNIYCFHVCLNDIITFATKTSFYCLYRSIHNVVQFSCIVSLHCFLECYHVCVLYFVLLYFRRFCQMLVAVSSSTLCDIHFSLFWLLRLI